MAGERSIIRRIVSVFDRKSADQAQGEMVQSLGKAGEEGGKKAGQNFLRDLRAEFNKRKAELAEQLARGTIDQKEFKKQTDIAAKTFNDGLLKGIEEARRQGKLTDAEYTKLTRSIKRVGDEGQKHIGGRLVDALKKAAIAAAALFGIRQITRFARESIRAAEALQAVQRGLEQQLYNVGVAWNEVSHEVRAHARALWDTHRLTQGEVLDILRQLVVVTGDYAVSLRAVGTVQNIVKATGLGVEQASRLLGRALNGEITVFRRYGLVLDETRDILEQLDERFQGAAKAGTTAGEALTKAWGDFKEAFGAALMDVAEGESVLDRVTNAVRWMADNVDELLHTVKALTIAIGVMIGVKGLAGMVVAFRAATAAVLTFRTAMMGFWAMIGPKGWFVLGVVAVTEAIRRSGAAARQAARDMQVWEDSLRAMSLEELYQELRAVTQQRREVEAQLEQFQRTGNKRLAADAERRLEIIRQGGFKIIAEINRLQNQITPERPGAPGVPGRETAGPGSEAEVEGARDLLDIWRQYPGAMLHIEQAQSQARAQAERMEEAWGRLNSTMEVSPKNAQALADSAAEMESAWVEAMAAIEAEAHALSSTIHTLFYALASGGIEGLARVAKAKVAENLARAAENFAKAWGWIAGLNPAGAAAAKTAAVGHLGAAAKWGAVAGVAGGMSGGGSGGSLRTSSVPSMTQAGGAQPAGPEVHIYFDGPGFDAVNPHVQRVIAGAVQNYGERYGPNAKVTTHRRKGG